MRSNGGRGRGSSGGRGAEEWTEKLESGRGEVNIRRKEIGQTGGNLDVKVDCVPISSDNNNNNNGFNRGSFLFLDLRSATVRCGLLLLPLLYNTTSMSVNLLSNNTGSTVGGGQRHRQPALKKSKIDKLRPKSGD